MAHTGVRTSKICKQYSTVFRHAGALSQRCIFDLENIIRHLPGCDAALSRVNAGDGILPEAEADRGGEDFAITNAQSEGP